MDVHVAMITQTRTLSNQAYTHLQMSPQERPQGEALTLQLCSHSQARTFS